MNHHQKHLSACLIALAALFSTAPMGAWAAVAPTLGTASTFAILAATDVTNVGPSIVTGDLGVSPGVSCTGFTNPSCTAGLGIVTGTVYTGVTSPNLADSAQGDAGTAYSFLQTGQACDFGPYAPTDVLGGPTLQNLAPGVYCFSSSAQLTGTLNLTGAGPWIFQIGSTLTTASNSSVLVNSGSQTCSGSNVFWAVGSSATLGTGTKFVGNILAFTSIGLDPTASLDGRALALGAAVTLSGTNTVTGCNATTPPPPPPPSCDKDHDGKGKDGKGKDGDCKDKDGDGHDKDKDHGHDKDKDHKDDSRHSFKDGGNPFGKDEHGGKK
jgi:hypothetical protein